MLLIYCFMYLLLFVRVLCWSLFWYALLYVFPSFCNLLDEEERERERADRFALIVFWMSCYCKFPVALPHGDVG